MAIPSKQIGWSTRANLLWQISKQLENLTRVMYNGGGTSTTTSTTTVAPTTTTTSTTVAGSTTTTTTAVAGSYAYGASTSNYVDRPTACAATISIPLALYAATSDQSAVTRFYTDAGLTNPYLGDNTSYYVYFRSSVPGVKHTANISSTTGNLSSIQAC
jgi:hypothetical protein